MERDAAPAAPAARERSASRRALASVPDMIRSLAVVLLAVGVVALITLRPGVGGGPRVITYDTELVAARSAAPYEVFAPIDLDGYRATRPPTARCGTSVS